MDIDAINNYFISDGNGRIQISKISEPIKINPHKIEHFYYVFIINQSQKYTDKFYQRIYSDPQFIYNNVLCINSKNGYMRPIFW
jgi:hypothetical protein